MTTIKYRSGSVDRCLKRFLPFFFTVYLNLFAWIINENRRIKLLKQVIICSQDHLRQWWFISVLTILRGLISHISTDAVCSLGVWVIKSLPLLWDCFLFPSLQCSIMEKEAAPFSSRIPNPRLLSLQGNNWKMSPFLADLTFTLFVMWLCEKLSDTVWRNSKRNSSCDLQCVNPNHFTILLRDNTQLNLFLSTGFSSLPSISC